MSENEDKTDDQKSRGRAFFDKALSDPKKSNYSVAEFYLQAAVKEDPENPEYQVKLEEVKKMLAREKGTSGTARAGGVPPPGLSAPGKPKAGKKSEKAAAPGPRIFGIPVKGLNLRVISAVLGILIVTTIAYSIYHFTHPENSRVNIADIRKIYGIELKTASIGEGKFQGFITEAWNAMPREAKDKNVKQLFRDFQKSRGIKKLILWDENYSAAAEASDSGVNISP